MIEPEGGIARDLDVLALVVADRDLIGVVEQDVGGLQRGVGEEPAADEILLAFGRLVLELCQILEAVCFLMTSFRFLKNVTFSVKYARFLKIHTFPSHASDFAENDICQ